MLKLFFMAVFFLPGLASANKNTHSVSFVAFGDSGYHYDYIKKKVLDNPQTPDEFVASKLKKWLENYLPRESFVSHPIYILPNSNHAVEASGGQAVADAMTSYCKISSCEFAIMLGDNIYPRGATGKEDEIRFKRLFEIPYRELVRHRKGFKLYAALGNHDWKTSREGRNIQIEYGEREDTAFTLKNPGYYSFTKGNVEFFVIDTNLLLAGTLVKEAELNPDGSEKPVDEMDTPDNWELPNNEDKLQAEWLQKSLKNSKAKWKVVYGHHTLWSAGGGKFEEARALRKLINPIVCKYADVYIAGHEHDLEMNIESCEKELTTSKHPLPLVVTGAGSWQRPVHPLFLAQQEAKYPQFSSLWSKGMTWGFTHFEFTGNKMIVKMITTPNDSSGSTKLEKVFIFPNRSQKLLKH